MRSFTMLAVLADEVATSFFSNTYFAFDECIREQPSLQ